MRDMWPFTGGSHYTSILKIITRIYIKKLQNYKKIFKNITLQLEWLKNKAIKSNTLKF